MTLPRPEPFPFEAVRDLLGILRAMYAAAHRRGDEASLAELRGIGRELRAALELALARDPGTLAHAAAWRRAERATLALGRLVDATTPLEPTITAAAQRLAGTSDEDGPAARGAARRARRARG